VQIIKRVGRITEVSTKSNNCSDHKHDISGLTSKGKGDAFELVVKYYLMLYPKYPFLQKKFCIFDKISTKTHKKINLLDRDMEINIYPDSL